MSAPRASVRLDSLSVNYIDVYWTVGAGAHNLLRTTYQVFRSESPAGPFDAVSHPLIDTYHVRDYIAPRKMAWRNLYYLVESHDLDTGEKTRSEPISLDARPPLDALEMIRLNSLLFREYNGRPVLIYGVRTFGPRCTNCYDPVSGRRTASTCKTCYNTSYLRGYHQPIVAYMQIDPQQRVQQAVDTMMIQQSIVGARMSVYPLVKQGDLIIEREGTRYRVQGVNRTERLRAPVHQEVTLYRIPEGDVEYSIEVKWPEYETSPRSFSPRSDL